MRASSVENKRRIEGEGEEKPTSSINVYERVIRPLVGERTAAMPVAAIAYMRFVSHAHHLVSFMSRSLRRILWRHRSSRMQIRQRITFGHRSARENYYRRRLPYFDARQILLWADASDYTAARRPLTILLTYLSANYDIRPQWSRKFHVKLYSYTRRAKFRVDCARSFLDCSLVPGTDKY